MPFNSEVPQFKESHLVVIRHDGLRMIDTRRAAIAITCETGVRVSYLDVYRAVNESNSPDSSGRYPKTSPVAQIGNAKMYLESDMYALGKVIAATKTPRKYSKWGQCF